MSISNCGKDERGKYTGGQSGDQTGKEWHIIPWYNRPWDCVIRHPNAEVRKMISDMAQASAKNDNIGYDQWQRLTYWEELKKVNYKPENIKNKCEADCSSGVCSIVKAVGYRKNIQKLKDIPITTTHYMKEYFKKAGFKILTDSKYLATDDYLLEGDILLNIQHHTATNITNGSKAKVETTTTTATKTETSQANKDKTIESFTGYVTATELNVRKGAGTKYDVLGTLKKGKSVKVIAQNGSWYKIEYNKTKAYVSKSYISKTKPATKEKDTFKEYSVKVTAKSGLNIRSKATTLSSKIGAIAYGKKVTISKVSGKWGYVADKKGWICLSYTTKA